MHFSDVPVLLISSDGYLDVLKDWIAHATNSSIYIGKIYVLVNTRPASASLMKWYHANYASHNSNSFELHVIYSSASCWGVTLRYGLAYLQEAGYQYAIALLEDFFVNSIDFVEVNKLCDYQFDICYLGPRPMHNAIKLLPLDQSNNHDVNNRFGSIRKSFKYGISLQPALWNLASIDNYLSIKIVRSAWDFEGSICSSNLSNTYRSLNKLIKYDDQAVEKGKWYPLKALRYRKFSKRKIVNLNQYAYLVIEHCVIKTFNLFLSFIIRLQFCFQKTL